MKKLTTVLLTAALFACIGLITGCEGPEGPQGPQGPPGTPGVSFEGFADSIQCGSCHTPDIDTMYYVFARKYQWGQSLHAVGGNLERNGSTCAGCHSTEGLLERWNEGWTTQVVDPVLNPAPINCFACHSPHMRGDFSLREADPVNIVSFVNTVPDAVFDYGPGNMCVQCHQTRTSSAMSPKPDPTAPTATISITSSRWYPHYGVQGQMLMGEGGFEFADVTYTGNSNHTNNPGIKENGCAGCHMAEQADGDLGTGNAGGHTMKITWQPSGEEPDTSYFLAGCEDAGCHGENFSTTTNYAGSSTAPVGAQTAIHELLDSLHTILIDRGYINPATGLVNASSSSPLVITNEQAGALFNFWFVEHEGSFGIHNTKYAKELLESSIAKLTVR